MIESLNMTGKKILITGVSRSQGIGATLAKRFAKSGASLAIHGYSDYDIQMQYSGVSKDATSRLAEELSKEGLSVIALTSCDLSKKDTPEQVVNEANQKLGTLNGLILNHAYSTHAPIGEWTAEHIDSHLLTNVRASMLMIQSFAKQADASNKNGNAITLFTSGQYLGPMIDEIAYAVSKDAIIGLCRQASAALAFKNIRVNCINPGPNDTGYLTGADYNLVANLFPSGRWGTPNDAADLLLFLHSDYSKWITGQVIASEGGFRRG